METSNALHTDPARPDFTAFDAGVRTRLAQRRTLPPDAIEGVERLGRLVQVLRIKQRWSLEALAAQTGLPWVWLALLEQGALLPSELTPETVRQLGQAFPLQHGGADPATLFHTLVEAFHSISSATQAPPAAGAELSAPSVRQPTVAREPGNPQEETPARPLRLLNTPGPGQAPLPSSLWAGGSTELLTDFVCPPGLAAETKESTFQMRRCPSPDGRAEAAFRALPDGQVAVTIETWDEQLAHRPWGFRFARQDGTELFSSTMTLQPVPAKPGRWGGRVVQDWTFTEPYTFQFAVLASDAGDTL